MNSVLFINRSYWPDAEATGQLLTDLCESLSNQFHVAVLCGQPNSNPAGIEFVSQGTEVRNGVTIHRLVHTQYNKRKSWGRMANLASFTLATRRWLRRNHSFDAIVSETDPFLLPLVVAPHCRRTGSKYVAYLQDIYPDIAIRLEKASDNVFTRQLRRRLCHAYTQAARIVVLSPAMKDELLHWGLKPNQFSIVPNWVDCDSVVPHKVQNSFRAAQQWNDAYVVMHSGNMGMSQKLCSLVQSIDHPKFPVRAKLAIVGGGADEVRLKQLAANSKRAQDIHFMPYQDRASLSQSLSAADLHVVSVDPRIGGTLMPSKLYGILASATPVLVIADPASDVAKVVTQAQVGIVVPSHEPAAIADGVAQMASLSTEHRIAMQDRARQLAKSTYDRSICVEQFASVLHQVLHSSSLCR